MILAILHYTWLYRTSHWMRIRFQEICVRKFLEIEFSSSYYCDLLTVQLLNHHQDVAMELLQQGADTSISNHYDQSAYSLLAPLRDLEAAIRANNMDLFTSLLDESADINAPSQVLLRTPLHEAAQCGHGNIT